MCPRVLIIIDHLLYSFVASFVRMATTTMKANRSALVTRTRPMPSAIATTPLLPQQPGTATSRCTTRFLSFSLFSTSASTSSSVRTRTPKENTSPSQHAHELLHRMPNSTRNFLQSKLKEANQRRRAILSVEAERRKRHLRSLHLTEQEIAADDAVHSQIAALMMENDNAGADDGDETRPDCSKNINPPEQINYVKNSHPLSQWLTVADDLLQRSATLTTADAVLALRCFYHAEIADSNLVHALVEVLVVRLKQSLERAEMVVERSAVGGLRSGHGRGTTATPGSYSFMEIMVPTSCGDQGDTEDPEEFLAGVAAELEKVAAFAREVGTTQTLGSCATANQLDCAKVVTEDEGAATELTDRDHESSDIKVDHHENDLPDHAKTISPSTRLANTVTVTFLSPACARRLRRTLVDCVNAFLRIAFRTLRQKQDRTLDSGGRGAAFSSTSSRTSGVNINGGCTTTTLHRFTLTGFLVSLAIDDRHSCKEFLCTERSNLSSLTAAAQIPDGEVGATHVEGLQTKKTHARIFEQDQTDRKRSQILTVLSTQHLSILPLRDLLRLQARAEHDPELKSLYEASCSRERAMLSAMGVSEVFSLLWQETIMNQLVLSEEDNYSEAEMKGATGRTLAEEDPGPFARKLRAVLNYKLAALTVEDIRRLPQRFQILELLLRTSEEKMRTRQGASTSSTSGCSTSTSAHGAINLALSPAEFAFAQNLATYARQNVSACSSKDLALLGKAMEGRSCIPLAQAIRLHLMNQCRKEELRWTSSSNSRSGSSIAAPIKKTQSSVYFHSPFSTTTTTQAAFA
ncbi:unnamed protein product [Amoebophrya sp. A120]|nr:unnamed protein product [Amoebophrya sp. A120]|eukprot:GSA120T00024626001.1